MVIEDIPEFGAFAWSNRVRLGASNENKPVAVPRFSPILSLSVKLSPWALVDAHTTLVTVYHEVVKHLCVSDAPTTPITVVGVESLTAKFSPFTVTDAPPFVGPFWNMKYVTIGPA
jgi:hypothetical protein